MSGDKEAASTNNLTTSPSNQQDDASQGSSSSFGVRETNNLRRFRSSFTLFLALFGIALGTGLYFLIRRQEESELADSFDDSTTRLIDQVHSSIENKIGALESLSFSISSYASFKNATWPFVTLPDFEYQAASVRALSQAVAIELCPLVSESSREAWEAYSTDNRKWIDDAVDFEELVRVGFFHAADMDQRRLDESSKSAVTNKITYFAGESGGDRVSVPSSEFYFPVWQSSPVSKELVNLDLHSTNKFASAIDLLVETKQAIIGTTVDSDVFDDPVLQAFDKSFDDRNGIEFFDTTGPVGFVYVPVFDVLNSDIREPVALLTAALYWESYMFQALPPKTPEILVVLRNDCGGAFTYLIIGEFVQYVGIGDLHDRKYDPFKVDTTTFEFESLQGSLERYHGVPLSDACEYHMEIYPTKDYEDRYLTARPWIFFWMAIGAILLLIAMIYSYDRRVEKNYRLVYRRAKQAGAIVSSIFPAAVRRRMYADEEDSKKTGENSGDGAPASKIPSAINANKAKIKGFLNETSEKELGMADNSRKGLLVHDQDNEEDAIPQSEKPFADTFPEVTILFAGVVGFAAWSSQRDPSEVFTFLQDLYYEFDTIARQMGVFKVETVGDSYVAATGMPEPQSDHATRMAKFARRLMLSMTDVTRSLEVRLGPDTGELKLRIGLHSGPVTAGVLRGAKTRFQLFGDTMNTAARMEQNSLPGRIQCSWATADLLEGDRKGHWFVSREGKISLKGKGEKQTFWLSPQSDAPPVVSVDGPNSLATPGSDALENEQLCLDLNAQNNRFHRLIDWNVELLSDLLKQIEARRRASQKKKFGSKDRATTPRIQLQGGSSALDEVSEIVALPQKDVKMKKQTRASDIELSAEILGQLRDYVTTIASMYRPNHFHSFEHASHVSMSAKKLLNRIVIPSNTDEKRESEDSQSDLHDYTFGITSDPLTQFTLVFCALIHDVDHAGVSNYQLIQEKATIAFLYKNKSVAEQNSVDLSWDLLMDPAYSDLQKAIYKDEEELKRFRQLVVNIVLATDIFDSDMKSLRDRRWDRAFQYANEEDEEEKTENLPVKALDRNYDTPLSRIEGANLKATIVMEHLIQASDVIHTMQHWDVYLKWNERLFNEMYLAYKCGRAVKDPSSTWYEGEIMFFDKYVIPLAKKLAECRVFGVASEECLNYATQNRKQWAIVGDTIVRGFLERFEERKISAPSKLLDVSLRDFRPSVKESVDPSASALSSN